VLADAYEDESLHPLMGYATDGASKIFDGLIRHDAQRVVQPALATEVPEASADGRSYTVRLRDEVSFHDGSSFGAEDVVATYRTLLDPESVSPLTTEYAMISKVEQVDDMTVRFDLAFPYAPFPHKLVLGIVPSEAVAGGGALEGSSFNSAPIGTGPFRLAEWRKGERMILESNESYWDGAPEVERLIVVFATDDNTRAQRMRSGEFDGTVLPPALAETFRGVDGYRLISHQSADYRTIMMPMNNPVTGDPGMRLALNYAANRQGMIDALLAGHGAPASNPIPEVLGDYAEPSAQFATTRPGPRRSWTSRDG
jgi:ABC-type dipeptide transport system, periplasmic component